MSRIRQVRSPERPPDPQHNVVDAAGAGFCAKTGGGASGRDDLDGWDVVIADIAPYCVSPESAVREVIAQIERNSDGLALVVDAERHLLATVTDGDIRRAILAGVDLDGSVGSLPDGRPPRGYEQPVTAPQGTSTVRLLQLMGEHAIRHVPLLNSEDRIVAIASLSRLGKSRDLPLHAVIMAGGLGTRLRPLTDALPKPMLPVGGRPLLQHTVERLRDTGICNIHITTHYKADKITAHFGDGGSYNAAVQYSHEDQPLGTAGALKQIDVRENEPLLVINGDVLTTVNYRAMLEYHREHQAQLTMGIRRYVIKVPYGVVECEGPDVRELREKPEVGFFVNAGIYLVEPLACQEIPDGQRFDMTDLINLLITQGQRVVSFPIHEYWLDIGRIEDYERAQEDVHAGKL